MPLADTVGTHSIKPETSSRTGDSKDYFQIPENTDTISTMANAIPYDVKDITANYSSTAKQFSVTANALLPIPFITAEFRRIDKGSGTRKFRLEGFAGGGAGKMTRVMMDKPYVENGMTSPPPFQSISVVLANPSTEAETTVTVSVTRDAPAPLPVPLKPQPLPASSTKSNASALPAIDIALPAQNFVRITAPISEPTGFRTTVEGRNEGDASFTWRAGQLSGMVYWDVAWSGSGAGSGKGATFSVTTTVAKITPAGGASSQGGTAGAQVSVQPYAIRLPMAKKPIEDLVDPDA